eukprot:jgi/Botrbrau1/11516/Bobra.0198s0013.1
MPKSGKKKKNKGVGIDFKKVKHKVGKKLPAAQNATDTTIRSRVITLPGQSVAADRGDAPVSQRNLTLKELLVQTGHYSGRVRKGALLEMMGLFIDHPQQLRQQVGPVVEKLAARVGDAEAGVRSALRELLGTAVLPQVGGPALAPFIPLLTAHVGSAMTHISADIRADALPLLELLLEAAPQQVAGSFLGPALQHYGDLLAPVTRSQSLSGASLSSLFKVVKGLEGFLSRVAKADHADGIICRGTGTGTTGPLCGYRCDWVPRELTHLLAGPGPSSTTPAEADVDSVRPAVQRLLACLLECWEECTPGQLGHTPDLAAVHCMEAVLNCTAYLLDRLPPAAQNSWADRLIRRVAVHVPAPAPPTVLSTELLAAQVALNLSASGILVRYLPPAAKTAGDEAEVQEEVAQEAAWLGRLLDFYTRLLERGEALPSANSFAATRQKLPAHAIPLDAYSLALQGVERALGLVGPRRRAGLLAALDCLIKRSGARTPLRALALQMQERLIASPGNASCHGPQLAQDQVARWVEDLPRLVWELGDTNPEASLCALTTIHSAARFCTPGGPLASSLDHIQPQVAALFVAVVPAGAAQGATPAKAVASAAGTAKRKRAKKVLSASQAISPAGQATVGAVSHSGLLPGGKALVAGPLSRLPLKCQELAVDLLYFYPTVSEAALRSVCHVCLTDLYPPAVAERAVDIVACRAADLPATPFLGLLLSLIIGKAKHVLPHAGWERHAAVLLSASRCVASLRDCGMVMELLTPALLDAASGKESSVRAWLGLLYLAAEVVARAARKGEPDHLKEMPGTRTLECLPSDAAAPLTQWLGVSPSGAFACDLSTEGLRGLSSLAIEGAPGGPTHIQTRSDTSGGARNRGETGLPDAFMEALPSVIARFFLWWATPGPAAEPQAAKDRPSLNFVLKLLAHVPELLPGVFSSIVQEVGESGGEEGAGATEAAARCLTRLCEEKPLSQAILACGPALHQTVQALRQRVRGVESASLAGAGACAALMSLQQTVNDLFGLASHSR